MAKPQAARKPGKRAELRKQQRERLLFAAARTFQRLGYNDASVADVLKEAGMSRRSFYEFFDSKEDILIQYVQGGAERMSARLDEIAREHEADPLLGLDKLVETFLVGASQVPMIGYQVIAAGEKPRAVRAKQIASLCARVSKFLESAYRGGKLARPPDPVTVRMLVDAMDSLALRYHLEGRPGQLPETKAVVLELFLRAFR